MTTIFRAVSSSELHDFNQSGLLRTSFQSLEAKQFFKTRVAVNEFVKSAKQMRYHPPYKHLLVLTVDSGCVAAIAVDKMELDGFKAISVPEELLPAFNNCVNFVKVERL